MYVFILKNQKNGYSKKIKKILSKKVQIKKNIYFSLQILKFILKYNSFLTCLFMFTDSSFAVRLLTGRL